MDCGLLAADCADNGLVVADCSLLLADCGLLGTDNGCEVSLLCFGLADAGKALAAAGVAFREVSLLSFGLADPGKALAAAALVFRDLLADERGGLTGGLGGVVLSGPSVIRTCICIIPFRSASFGTSGW